MKRMAYKAIHMATAPFVDKGPFGGGPVTGIGVGNRSITKAINKLNDATWTPPAALFSGRTGAAVTEMGRMFPLLDIGDGSQLNATHKDFCERLLEAAERAAVTGNIGEAVATKLGDGFRSFKPELFLARMKDPTLREVDEDPAKTLRAVGVICCAEIGNIPLTLEDWKAVAHHPSGYLTLDEEGFAERLQRAHEALRWEQEGADNGVSL